MVKPITLNVHPLMSYGRQYSKDEKERLNRVINYLDPSSILVMDWIDKAIEFKERGLDVIYRQSLGRVDGYLWRSYTAIDYYKIILPLLDAGFRVQVLNEPKPDKGFDEMNMISFMCDLMDIASSDGNRLVLYNVGSGVLGIDHPEYYKDLWEKLTEYQGLHTLGIHEMGSEDGFLFSNGTDHDVIPWHIGRFDTFLRPYLAKNHYEFDVDVTEFCTDHIYSHNKKRFWKEYFTELEYSGKIIEAVKRFYHRKYVNSVCIAYYGNTGRKGDVEDWYNTDVSTCTDAFFSELGVVNRLLNNGIQPKPDDKPDDTNDTLRFTSVSSNDGKVRYLVSVSNAGYVVIKSDT